MTIDATVPNVARMYDYYLGGYHNFAADREAAEKILAIFPDTPAAAHGNRRFMQRAVRYLTDRGVRQFLDIGAGLPTQGNVHEQTDGRVVYVDNDPVAVAQARTLVDGAERVSVAQADLREPDALLSDPHVSGHLDFAEPIAVMLVSIMHFVPDEDRPWELVARLRGALAPGSAIVLSHLTLDGVDMGPAEQGTQVYRRSNAPIIPRTRAGIERFFAGFELVDPGLVWIGEWHPKPGEDRTSHGYGGVGIKP
ncbi:SAM-dependent methyltransferase [Dactylosporangium sp. NPDC051541]|uniref:SAM-dependent methyltransferase n=1 Tax=Dactylosporangium sp. NPDC051541 TaxID=3363977 RepID=UPI0037A3172F